MDLHARKRKANSSERNSLSLDTNINADSSLQERQKPCMSTVRAYYRACIIISAIFILVIKMQYSDQNPFGISKKNQPLPPRFVTVVDSGSEVNPGGRHDRLMSIKETWGPAGHAIFVVNDIATEFPEGGGNIIISSNSTTLRRQNNNDDDTTYPRLMPLPKNLAARSVPALQYTIRTLLDRINPDFAFFTNCHTYVIPEHLCSFLKDKSPSDDLYAGHALKNAATGATFHPASSGYVLSRSAMQKLVQKWDERNQICLKEKQHPGFFLSKCFKEEFNIKTDDFLKYKQARAPRHNPFSSFPLMRLIKGEVDSWYLELSENENIFGEDCCSESSISFHYTESFECRAFYATQKLIRENPSISDDKLKNFMIENWPTGNKVGGYSRPLPTSTDDKLWKSVLNVIRKISSNDEC